MQKILSHYGLILMVFCFAGPVQAQASQLNFSVSGLDNSVTIPLAALHASCRAYDIQVDDPFYLKTKHYRAFRLQDVLSQGFGKTLTNANQNSMSLTFLSRDGYNPVLELERLNHAEAWIAFEDKDVVSGWEPLGSEKTDSAPFYLVWTNAGDMPKAYPWPRQLTGITLTVFEQAYSFVVPGDASPGEAVDRGYRLFRNRCLVCHAMNRQGGNKGPDLLAPKAIVTYRLRSFLESYIPRPSSYRFSQMPDSPDLDKKAVDDLIAYLVYIARQDRQKVPDYP